jgi:hypothetical protein
MGTDSRDELQKAAKKFSIFWKLTQNDLDYKPF